MSSPSVQPGRRPEPSEGASPETPSSYVALLYFHGIGQQRHYEGIGALVENLGGLIRSRHRGRDKRFPNEHLRAVRTRSELERRLDGGKTSETVVYIEARYGPPWRSLRFYEAYWAPTTVGGTSAASVLLWILRQWPRPLQVLLSRWRTFERLRRASLVRLYHQPGEVGRRGVPKLVKLLSQTHVRSFRSFLDYIRQKVGDKELRAELVDLARRWRRRHRWEELRTLTALTSLLAGVSAATLLVLWLIYQGLVRLRAALAGGDEGGALQLLGELVGEPDLETTLSVLLVVVTVLGLRGFLRDYVGDVQQFATYEESDERHRRRRAVLDAAVKSLHHVLLDPQCERVVILGHSLGTSVALDALMELRRQKDALGGDNPFEGEPDIGKIQHFLTLGSPIDKINYFFSTVKTRHLSYERVVNYLRGDIGEPPFSLTGRQPWIHWVNFWDRGDPISGALHTATASILRDQRVDNVQLATYRLPDPGGSHAAYFESPQVLETLFEATYANRYSFPAARAEAQVRRDRALLDGRRREAKKVRARYEWLGPGESSRLQRWLLSTLFLLPWSLVWTLIDVLRGTSTGAVWVLAGLLALLALGPLAHKIGGAEIR